MCRCSRCRQPANTRQVCFDHTIQNRDKHIFPQPLKPCSPVMSSTAPSPSPPPSAVEAAQARQASAQSKTDKDLLSSSCHVALSLGGGRGRVSSSSSAAAAAATACSSSSACPTELLRSRQRAQRFTRAPTCPDSMWLCSSSSSSRVCQVATHGGRSAWCSTIMLHSLFGAQNQENDQMAVGGSLGVHKQQR